MKANAGIPFAGQRMISMALVLGMAMYAIAVGVILKVNDGVGVSEEPIEVLDTIATIFGIVAAVLAVFIRILITKKAAATDKDQRAKPRLLALFIPLGFLEAGCVLAITAWMLNGNAVPSLAVACVLLSIAIAMIPLQDPDADTA
jgi:hypothetical protein